MQLELNESFSILIVERNAEDSLKLKDILLSNGFQTLTLCTTAKQAIDLLFSGHSYDLCFIDDSNVPGDISGLEFCAKVSKLRYSMPVLFLTSSSNENELIQLIRSGAHGFIQKPFRQLVLMDHVRSACRISQSTGRKKVMTEGLKQNQLRFQAS